MNNEQLRTQILTYRPTVTAAPSAAAHYSLFTIHYSLNHSFSAKERDTETGLSYFGARYYSSDLSIWLSVDPMSDKYPYQTNYVYCSNNPIMVADPNGEEEWELARDGTLTPIKDGRTDVDVVHATTANGETVCLELPAQSVNKEIGSYKYFDKDNKERTTNYMTFDKQDGFDFFEFAAENTVVEWIISSSDTKSIVGRSNAPDNICLPPISGEKERYHSHDVFHSGKDFIGIDDYNGAQDCYLKNVKTGTYMAQYKTYYIYEERKYPNGKFFDYFGTNAPERKVRKPHHCD